MTIKADIFSRKRYFILIILLLFISQASFSQKDFYTPKALVIPVHTNKQELHVSLGIGGGYDANLSYALSKHFAIFTTGTINTGSHKRTSFWGDGYRIDKNDHALTGGIGYFSTTNHKLVNVVESYAGYGSYKIDNYWYFNGEKGVSGYKTQARYWNVFWQFQGTHKIKSHEFTGALRLAYNKYYSFQYKDVNRQEHVKTTLDNLWGFTIDPAISYSYLIKSLKFNIQLGGSTSLNGPVTLDEMHYRKENDQIIATENPGITKIGIAGAMGRLSIQYNFDFKKK